ncbi:replication initiator protein A [Bacillus cereus]|uniref:replication initiator protein A n=3 Tax=Bacillales TaxID=1385 RepID=UPI0021B27D43|nr:replication initiator protein A [Bacillus cereus]
MLNIKRSVHYYNYAQQYYMMPKSVVEFLKDNNISLGACDLYMYLRDRYKLSLEKVSKGYGKYEDELGVFCIFTREEMCEITGKDERTVRRWYNELKKCGLIQYRQVKKEKGQANRFYIKEEQLVDSDVIALYTSEEYKPVVHYNQLGADRNVQSSTNIDVPSVEGLDKNVQSSSGQKCPPNNNSLLINNIIKDYVLSYIERHNFEIDDTLKEKIANNYKGAIMSVEEKNERLNSMIDTYIKNEEKLELGDTSEVAKNKRKKGVTRKGTGHSGSIGSKKKTTRKEMTPDWLKDIKEGKEEAPKEATQEEIERLAMILAKQKEEPQAPNPTLETKKELIQTPTGYQEAIVMPKGSENPFLEVLEQKEGNYTNKEEKLYTNENETFEDYNNTNIPTTYMDYTQSDRIEPSEVKGNTKTETPKLTGNQLFRISKLTKKANSGDVEAWRKCESLEMKRFVEIGERGRFKVKDDILTAM